ncbi:ankyrin repeat domain-containing protein [Oceanibium sediminis]|uniref:ankyrin repeat domain-containing protein n=1 Tax=Oceanibium sediminis TaxID=2026339 RepID=UPI00130047BC|nr:ankyrin repeat domain-containing protein [Oceanibium sediminis]
MTDTQPIAQLPTSHSALLYAVSLFCPPEWQHAERRRYARSEMRLEGGADRTLELLDLLRQSLSQEQAASLWGDVVEQILRLGNSLDALELHTKTYSATPKQTLWVLLAFDVMPALGRTWGFWCQDEPVLPRMPEDDLWFLPHQDPSNPDRLILPVETILSWWLEQIDGPLDRLWGEYDDERRRTLDNWKSGRRTPAISRIMEWFSDDYQFSYKSSDEAHLSTAQLRSLLLWARAIEQAYKDLLGYLTPGVAPNDADPVRNKALQLIELFRWSHEATVATDPTNPAVADQEFVEALPTWVKEGPFRVITPDRSGRLLAAEQVAEFLGGVFIALPCDETLPDIFGDPKLRSPATLTFDLDRADRQRAQESIENIRVAWQGKDPARQIQVAEGLAKLRKSSVIVEFEPDLEYLCALHALSSGNFDEARQHAEKALELCLTRSIGPVKLDIAKLNFSLAVAQDAFNRGSAERSFRILCKSVQPQDAASWKLGEGPIDYSMRLAAADHAEWFWGSIVRPYEGVELEAPLHQEDEITRAYVGLLLSGASEDEVRGFIKQFRGKLKRKLRDVRGDTFFTVTSKMVAHMAPVMRQMPTYSGIPKEPFELANSMVATHLKLVSLLPTDVLDARDYLKQTALMLAADRNDVDMVKALIDRHVDIDAQDALGRTALHSAAKVGADRCFEILLAAGANPTLQTVSGKTPALFAAEFGRATIFEMRLTCTAYEVGRSELKEAYKLARDSAEDFKAKRKAYAIQGYEIAGRTGFQRLAELASRALDECFSGA